MAGGRSKLRFNKIRLGMNDIMFWYIGNSVRVGAFYLRKAQSGVTIVAK